MHPRRAVVTAILVMAFGSSTNAAPVALQLGTLTASDAAAGDRFGISVAIDGDRVAVGSRFDDDGGSDSGSAYVFDLTRASAQTETTKLTASDAAPGDNFGISIAIDGGRVVVGSDGDDDAALNGGSAYVFDLTGAPAQTETTKLTASDADLLNRFGRSVSIAGDRVAVGAPSGASSGSAYVFDLTGASAQNETAKLNASDAAVGDNFGISVAIDGDRVAVGSQFDDNDAGSASGSAYVFDLTAASAQTETTKLTASDAAAGDIFGQSIDLDGDRVIVGSSRAAAYVFDLTGASAQTETTKLTESHVSLFTAFGSSVAIDGDNAVVGNPSFTDPVTSIFGTGAAYAFDLTVPTAPTETAMLTGPNPQNADSFGRSVAIDGSLMVVGSDGKNGSTGSAYVFLIDSESHWAGATDGTWEGAGNWTGANGLGNFSVSDVLIDTPASLTVAGPASDDAVNSLQIGGSTGQARLELQLGANLAVAQGVTIADNGILAGDGVITGNVDVLTGGLVAADNLSVMSTLTNAGVIAGSGRISANLVNAAGGEIRLGNGEMLDLDGPSFSNLGRVEVIGGDLEIATAAVNAASTGVITGRDVTLRFQGGLTNDGAVALSFGTHDLFGDVDNTATGQIVASGRSELTFYDDLHNDGEVRVCSTCAAVFFGEVSGAGGFTGTGDHFFEGDLRPGNSPALVAMAGNMSIGFLSTTEIEIEGLTRGTQYDAYDVAGDLALDGLLDVILVDPFALAASQSFEIFDVQGALTGMFAGLGEGALVGTFGGVDLFISYAFDDGNDVGLFTAAATSVSAPPFVTLVGLGAALLWHRRTKRRHAGRRD